MLDQKLRDKLDLVCRRQRIVTRLHATVWALVALGIAYMLVQILILWLPMPRFIIWWLPTLSAVVAFLRSWDNSHSLLNAARLADRQLGLQERLGTAVEFATYQHKGSPLVQQLQMDAASYVEVLDPDKLVPYRVPRHAMWLIPVFLVAMVLTGMHPHVQLHADTEGTAAQGDLKVSHPIDSIDDLAEHLQRAALEYDQPHLMQLSEMLSDLADRFRRGEISEADFTAELAAIEDQWNAALDDSIPGDAGTTTGTAAPELVQGPEPGQRPEGEFVGAPESNFEDQSGQAEDGSPAPQASDDTSSDRHDSPQGGSAEAEVQIDPDGIPSDDPTGGSEAGTDGASDPDASDPDDGTSSTEASDHDPANRPTDTESDRPDVRGIEHQLHGVMGESGATIQHLDSFARPSELGQQGPASANLDGDIESGLESSVDRENVPPAFRHWVQLYFERLGQ